MYKKNPYNGKKYKKKKVYTPIKDPYVVSDELAKKKDVSGIEIFMKLFDLEDAVWLLFFKDVLKGPYSTPLPNMLRLENIIYLTPNEGLQKQIYSELMDIRTYNPLVDEIPIERLSISIQNYIKKKQVEIENQHKLIRERTFYLKNDGCEFLIKGALAFNKKYQKINFKNGYGVLIYPLGNVLCIFSNFNLHKNNIKYKITLNDFYNAIVNEYPRTKLKGNGCVLIPLNPNDFSNKKIQNIINALQYNLTIKKG